MTGCAGALGEWTHWQVQVWSRRTDGTEGCSVSLKPVVHVSLFGLCLFVVVSVVILSFIFFITRAMHTPTHLWSYSLICLDFHDNLKKKKRKKERISMITWTMKNKRKKERKEGGGGEEEGGWWGKKKERRKEEKWNCETLAAWSVDRVEMLPPSWRSSLEITYKEKWHYFNIFASAMWYQFLD